MAVLRAPKKQQRLGNYPFALLRRTRCFLSRWFGPGAYKRSKFSKIASLLHPGYHRGPNRTALNRYLRFSPHWRRHHPVILLKARKYRSDRIRFVYASDHILSGLGGFDAIFCMAVLRSAGHYPFESFEERALFLETMVRPGGLLVIHNSPYRFGDTARKYFYETIPVDASRDIGSFLPDGVTEVEPDGSIFRKLELSVPARLDQLSRERCDSR
jgi:hypothetical protein